MCNNCRMAYQEYKKRHDEITPNKPLMSYEDFREDDEMVRRKCADGEPKTIQRTVRFFYNHVEIKLDLAGIEIEKLIVDDRKMQIAWVNIKTIDGSRTIEREFMDEEGTIRTAKHKAARVPLHEVVLDVVSDDDDLDCRMILHELSMCRHTNNWRSYKGLLIRLVNNMPYKINVPRHYGRIIYDEQYEPIHPTEDRLYSR